MGYAYMADERVLREMGFYKRHAYEREHRDIAIHHWDRDAAEAAIAAVQAENPEPTTQTAGREAFSA